MLGGEYSPEVYAKLKSQLGFDRSVVYQIFVWAQNLVGGDLGYSYIAHERVSKILMDTIPVTIQLSICSLIVAILIGPCRRSLGARQELLAGLPGDELRDIRTILAQLLVGHPPHLDLWSQGDPLLI